MAFGIADGYRVSYDPVGVPIVSISVDDQWIEIGRAQDIAFSYIRTPDDQVVCTMEDPVRGNTYEIRDNTYEIRYNARARDEIARREYETRAAHWENYRVNPNRITGCRCAMCTPLARGRYNDHTGYPRAELRDGNWVVDVADHPRQVQPFERYWAGDPFRPKSEADDKAEALLRRLLTDEQVAQWAGSGSVDVTGSEGTKFRVFRYSSGNVAVLDENGRDGGRLCAAPRQTVHRSDGRTMGYLPPADVVAGQILMLRTDEMAFWEIANTYISGEAVERRRREIMEIRSRRREAARPAGATQVGPDPLITWSTADQDATRIQAYVRERIEAAQRALEHNWIRFYP